MLILVTLFFMPGTYSSSGRTVKIDESRRSSSVVSPVSSPILPIEFPAGSELVRQWYTNKDSSSVLWVQEKLQLMKGVIPDSFRVVKYYDSDAGSEGLFDVPPDTAVRVFEVKDSKNPENFSTWYICETGEIYKR